VVQVLTVEESLPKIYLLFFIDVEYNQALKIARRPLLLLYILHYRKRDACSPVPFAQIVPF